MTYYVECDGKLMDYFEDKDSAFSYCAYLLMLHEGDASEITICTDTEEIFHEIA